jgi:tetrahydromethanopterin S-methyltransferase subunit E
VKTYNVRFYIGTTAASGYLDIEADCLDDAEANVVELLKQPIVNVVLGTEDTGRHAYFCNAITGYSITLAVVSTIADGD